MITISVDAASEALVKQLIREWPNVYGTAGVHPHSASEFNSSPLFGCPCRAVSPPAPAAAEADAAAAESEELEIHPDTMRQANRETGLIDHAIRNDERANALFLDLLCGRNDPEMVLRWMNEAGVFGKFVPDFGKVNAQMQFDNPMATEEYADANWVDDK